ncbi:MAG TPA: LLM class F420-dependent oxidoreductase [Acidimicrobiales bacterium]|nr:LLM class F420-dependent oxidoreductase [Acidimicrobiales bacterium]
MKLTTHLNYAGGFKEGVSEVAEMENAGLDLVWVAEAYGFDSPSLMGYLAARTRSVEIGAAILPIFTRTPSLIAMTAAGLDTLSDGRFHLGLGASGPQVIEGFHGVAYTNPLGRTREIIDICREIWRREAPLEHHGKNYQMPLPAGEGTGLGKPLKLITRPLRSDIPVWIASLGEKNVALTAEVANGWIPLFFIPERAQEVFGSALDAGRAKRSPDLGELQITAGGLFALGEDDATIALRERQRTSAALYIGGMGAKGKNFYNELAVRYGFEEEAARIQDLYLAGNKREAEAAVPEAFLELTTLCGPASYVAERIAAFKEAGVTHLQVDPVVQDGQTKASLIESAKAMI